MKVRASVKRICENCKLVRRQGNDLVAVPFTTAFRDELWNCSEALAEAGRFDSAGDDKQAAKKNEQRPINLAEDSFGFKSPGHEQERSSSQSRQRDGRAGHKSDEHTAGGYQ